MFVIKSPNKSLFMWNRKEDDFLRFMPEHLGCEADELEVFYFGNEARAKLKNYQQLSGAVPAIGEEGSLSAVIKKPGYFVEVEGEQPQYVPESVEVIETFEGQRVVEWPYTADGKFKGHKLQGD